MSLPLSRAFRLVLSVSVVTVAALSSGVALGLLVVLPALSYFSPSEETVAADSSRFERLVLDVDAPDPPVYRTPTPDFGPAAPPSYGKLAREEAQQALARRAQHSTKQYSSKRKARRSRPRINKEAADAFASAPRPSPFADHQPYRRRDRHTIF